VQVEIGEDEVDRFVVEDAKRLRGRLGTNDATACVDHDAGYQLTNDRVVVDDEHAGSAHGSLLFVGSPLFGL
jgi:hypothetical protein